MQIIEAALAFAITMLVLSLTCSSLVEIIHRVFAMREAGLKHMLGRIFDQVLDKYVDAPAKAQLLGVDKTQLTKKLTDTLRDSFVRRMSANRAPMRVTPRATPTDPVTKTDLHPRPDFGVAAISAR